MGLKTEEKGFKWLEVDAGDVLFLLRRHAILLCMLPALGFALAFTVSKLCKPVYSAAAVSYMRPNLNKEMQLEHSLSKLDDADSLRSFEEAMVADTVILRMVDKLGLGDDASFFGESVPPQGFSDAEILKKIRKRYSTKLVATTRLVELTVEDYSAERTVEIAETLIDEFLKLLRDDRNGKEDALRMTLLAQAEKALQAALASENKLKAFRSENPGTLVEQDSEIFHERILQNSSVLNAANSERSKIEGILSALESIDPEKDPFRVFQILNNRNSEYLSELLTMQAAAKSEMAAVKQRVTVQHRDYQAAASRLEEVEATLRNYAREMKASVESQYSAATGKVEKLGETMAGLQSAFVDFKSTSAAFRGVKEEIDRNWNTYTKLQQKIMDLDLDPEVTPTFMTPVSAPVVPYKKAKPRTLIFVAVGTFLGGLMALAIVYWRNRQSLPFTSAEQAGEQLAATSVTALAMLEGGERNEASQSALFNILVSLRNSRLLHITALRSNGAGRNLPRVLGRLFAERGSRTLLISFFHGLHNASEIEHDAEAPGLAILGLPANLLTSEADISSKFTQLLSEFDRLIVDSSALTEAQVRVAVAGIADANLLVVAGEPRKEHKQFSDLCTARGIPPMTLAFVTGEASEEKIEDHPHVGRPHRSNYATAALPNSAPPVGLP